MLKIFTGVSNGFLLDKSLADLSSSSFFETSRGTFGSTLVPSLLYKVPSFSDKVGESSSTSSSSSTYFKSNGAGEEAPWLLRLKRFDEVE